MCGQSILYTFINYGLKTGEYRFIVFSGYIFTIPCSAKLFYKPNVVLSDKQSIDYIDFSASV
jgi:hypothetical protein